MTGLFDTPEAEGFAITEEELFARLAELESQKLTISEDISQLKKDAKFHKKHNPQGILGEEVSRISAAAKLEAKRDFEESQAKTNAIYAKYMELTGYNA